MQWFSNLADDQSKGGGGGSTQINTPLQTAKLKSDRKVLQL